MKKIFLALALTAVAFAQSQVNQLSEVVETRVTRASEPAIGTGTPTHPFDIVVRDAQGNVKSRQTGHNLRTSAGTTWQYAHMFGTPGNIASYMALTNTAVTPAFADTTLSGEISLNGLARGAADSVTNASTTLAVPSAATAAVVGTTGAVTYYYWVAACNQGICTTPSAASNAITTANATLSTTNYNTVSFAAVAGASTYQVYRTTTSSAPSGTASVLVGGQPACTAAGSCIVLDTSNTLTSVVIPASNLTNYGKATLVKTWTCSSSAQSAQAFGIFDAASVGNLIFEGTFTQVNLNIGDTFQLTLSVYY